MKDWANLWTVQACPYQLVFRDRLLTVLCYFFMMDYCFDVYLEFVPMLCATTSPSECYEWEDAIINCYMIGELPLNQLANLAKQSFSLSVSLWLRRLQLDHGDDYCTSWYEMKEVLQR